MRCRDVHRLSSAYVDGELADGQASALRGHIRGCDACRALIEDEARLAGAAEDLAPLDPPPALWDQVRAQIAAEEIADGERGRLWLWWQGARQYVLPATVGAVAVAVLAVYLVRRGADSPAMPSADQVATADRAPAPAAPRPAAIDFDDARARELARADARYARVIADLREIVDAERDQLTGAERDELDRTLAELDREHRAKRDALELSGSLEVAEHRELHRIYEREIDVLRGIAMAGVTR